MHPLQAELEDKLQELFNKLDDYLEEKYGQKWPLHPNRLKRGKAASPIYDGLFSTGAIFTPGYDSTIGRGYIVDIDYRTLSTIPKQDKEMILKDAVSFLTNKFPEYFPNRNLKIVKDGNIYKIVGDFFLGSV